MKTFYDEKLVQKYIAQYGINCYFSNIEKIKMQIVEYSPGEHIQSPHDVRNLFQFLLMGEMSIYYIRDAGMGYSLAQGNELYMIGEMELFCKSKDAIYAEATSGVTCLAISLDIYREVLLNDITFVRKMAEAMADKLTLITKMEAEPNSLEERVTNYMQYRCKDHSFKGIEKTAFLLHCSTRQLQRVMNHLEEQGIVCKIGKGSYQLRKEN